MKKNLVMALAALIAASGCATGKVNHAGNGNNADGGFAVTQTATETAPKTGEVIGDMPTGRLPAQANQTYWAEDSRSVTINAQGGQANFTLSPRQIEVFQEQYSYDCDMYAWGTTTCYDWVCQGGKGSSPLWDAYYNGGGNRAASLDRALLGIGPSSADRLHRSGLFNSKPRSWQEFRTRMNQALRQNVITSDQYNEVFGKFSDQNRINLGYAGQNCQTQAYRCEAWDVFRVPNGCSGHRRAERTINTMNMPIAFEVRNPQLQPFETEVVTVKTGPDFDSLTVLRADKTDYKLVAKQPNGNGATLVIEGQGRYQINLPTEALQKVDFNDQRGQPINAVVSVDPKYIGSGDDKLMVSIQTIHCKPGGWWSLGECEGNDQRAKTVEPEAIHHVTQARQSFALKPVDAGRKVWAKVSIVRVGSRWYNNTPVAEREIEIDSLKK